jgi:imidazolonepropionase-like amidohydrolase
MNILKNCRLIDGLGGCREGIDIGFTEGRISTIGENLSDDVSYDVRGATVLPGFIDTHVHLIANAEADPTDRMKTSDEYLVLTAHKNAMTSLRSGFTTLCDKGSRNTVTLQLRRAITDGVVPGARLLVCGRVITPTGGHSHQTGGREADSPTECRRAAREQLKAGADLLNVMATGGVLTKGSDPNTYQFSTDEMRAVAEEAHKVGKRVAAHALSSHGIANAVAAGIDTIEHASLADKETIALMGEHQEPWVTTISAAKHNAESSAQPWIREKAEANIRRKRLIVQYARECNVKIVLGTDAGTPRNPHGDNTDEFIYLVENGLTEIEALLAGTHHAAEALGIEADVGTIEPGKCADFVVIDGNPLEEISTLKHRILLVFQNGEIVANHGFAYG